MAPLTKIPGEYPLGLKLVYRAIVARFKQWGQKFNGSIIDWSYGGDKIEHCLFRVLCGSMPTSVDLVVLHIGTNNLQRDSPDMIAGGIKQICDALIEWRNVSMNFFQRSI